MNSNPASPPPPTPPFSLLTSLPPPPPYPHPPNSILHSRWNFTIAQLQLMLIEGEDAGDGDFSCQLGAEQEQQWSINSGEFSNILHLSDELVSGSHKLN